MVFDGVVGAAFEDLGDLGPLVVDDAVHEEKNPLFLLVPIDFLDSWVQVIVPPFSALLADSAVQVLRDQCPLLGSVGHHELQNAPVFFGSPCALHVEWLVVSSDSHLVQIRAVRLVGLNRLFCGLLVIFELILGAHCDFKFNFDWRYPVI